MKINKMKIKRALPGILTAVACAGVVVTGILSAHAALKCEEELEAAGDISKGKTAKIIAKHAIAPTISGAVTIGSFIFARECDKRMIAGMSMATAAIANRMPTKDEMEARIDAKPVDKRVPDVVIDEDGEIVDDDYAGITIKIRPENLERGYYKLNRNYQLRGCLASLYEFYRLIGFTKKDVDRLGLNWTEFIGWDDAWGMAEGYSVIDCETLKTSGGYKYIYFPFHPMPICIDPPQYVKDLCGCEYDDIEAVGIIDEGAVVADTIACDIHDSGAE